MDKKIMRKERYYDFEKLFLCHFCLFYSFFSQGLKDGYEKILKTEDCSPFSTKNQKKDK